MTCSALWDKDKVGAWLPQLWAVQVSVGRQKPTPVRQSEQSRKSHIVASANSKKQAMGAGRSREHLEGLDVKKFNFETRQGPDQAEE